MDADCKDVPERPGYRHTRRWLHLQLLASVAPEVVSLNVGEGWLKMQPNSDELMHKPQHLLAQIPLLEALDLWLEPSRAVLHELQALRLLTRLHLGRAPQKREIQRICSTLALEELDIGQVSGRAADVAQGYCSRLLLDQLALGKTSGLQKLSLSLPGREVRDLSRLAGLSSLTELEVRVWGPPCDIGELTTLTGLKGLCITVMVRPRGVHMPAGEENAQTVATLSPLSALTALTMLDLTKLGTTLVDPRAVPPSVSALSCLTALRVLRGSFFDVPEFVEGDALPVQLHFLRTAPALEELDLGFKGPFWSLPSAAGCAMRASVSALTSLKQVRIVLHSPFENRQSNYYAPLAAFASAASIERLTYSYWAEDSVEEVPSSEAIAQALGCFTALTKLQSLHLAGLKRNGFTPACVDHGLIPGGAGMLGSLPSTRLTYLHLQVDAATPLLMEQIARFGNLRDLTLVCNSVSLGCVDPLFHLKCLTKVQLTASGDAMRAEYGGCASTIKAEVARLKSAILEYCRVVGRFAHVQLDIRDPPPSQP